MRRGELVGLESSLGLLPSIDLEGRKEIDQFIRKGGREERVTYRLKRISYDLSNNAAACTGQPIRHCVRLSHHLLFFFRCPPQLSTYR